MRRFAWVFLLLALAMMLALPRRTEAVPVITRTSSPVLYIDTSVSPGFRGMYTSYTIQNDATAKADVWVAIDSFSGGTISLGQNEDGLLHFGAMAANEARPAFFYLQAGAATATPLSHTVRVYNGRPATPTGPGSPTLTQLASASFTMTVEETIQAQANKVDTGFIGPNPPELGGTCVMTVEGHTGTIGAPATLMFSPATDPAWPAKSFEMTGSKITFTNNSGATIGQWIDKLLIPQAELPTTADTNYKAEYTFRAVDRTTAPTATSPTAFIRSGTQMKHTTANSFASILPVQPTVNLLYLGKSANVSQLAGAQQVTYSVTLTNPGTQNLLFGDIVDTIPSAPGAATYVAGSSTYNGGALPDPAISGSKLTWIAAFTIPPASTRVLTYKLNIPGTAGAYSNSVVAHYGTTQIDTTQDTSDNAPATFTVTVYNTPITGTVFEDVNYGGGAGRSLSASGGVPRPGARVELYDSTGAFMSAGTTAANGQYQFPVIPSQTYTVRVVSGSVTSSRTGSTSGLLPVLTFRTNGLTSDVGSADVNRVGGEDPTKVDAANGSTTLAALATATTAAQCVTQVVMGSSGVTGVDFGFNFDTVVNTLDSGQGSLRQFILNANALGNTGLAQVGQTAGQEVSLFMVSDGLAHAGLRAGLTNQLTGGTATVTLQSALPAITDSATTLTGATQTANIGDTNPGLVGTGGTVGTDAVTLAQFDRPEVAIVGVSSANAITVDGTKSNVLVERVSVYGASTGVTITAGSGSGNVVRYALIGAAANGTTPGAQRNQSDGISIAGPSAVSVNSCLVANNGGCGIHGTGGAAVLHAIGCEVTANGWNSSTGGGIALQGINSDVTASMVAGNRTSAAGYAAGGGHGIQLTAATGGSSATTVTNCTSRDNLGSGIAINNGSGGNTLSKNVVTGNQTGVLIAREASSTTRTNRVTRNSIYGNTGLGIDLVSGAGNAADGVSANDGSKASPGSNDQVDYPVITSVVMVGSTATVTGYVGSATGQPLFGSATVEIFLADNQPADQNGEIVVGDGQSKPHGEGKTYLATATTTAAGSFVATFDASGLAGLQITATATDTAGSTSEFGPNASLGTPPSLLLVKRITAINGVNLSGFVDDPTTTADNNANWPVPTSTYLRGAVNANSVRPGDVVEYTIYFLSGGGSAATNVTICDQLPANTTFVSGAFNGLSPMDSGGLSGAGLGIAVAHSSSSLPTAPTVYMTGAPDGDRGRYYDPGTTAPAAANRAGGFAAALPASENLYGVIGVALVTSPTTLPNATGPGTPFNSYGFIRFRVKVN